MQDLWMMISGSPAEQQRQWADLLEGYQQFAALDFREMQLIEPLRACACCITPRGSRTAGATRHSRAPSLVWRGALLEGYLRDLAEQIEAIDDPPLSRAG